MKLRKFWSVVGPAAPPWIHNWGGCGARGGAGQGAGAVKERLCCQGMGGGGAVHNSK